MSDNTGGGGAININFRNELISMSNCRFERNSAANGGALYIYDSNRNVTVMNCSFEENYAEYVGGRRSVTFTYIFFFFHFHFHFHRYNDLLYPTRRCIPI